MSMMTARHSTRHISDLVRSDSMDQALSPPPPQGQHYGATLGPVRQALLVAILLLGLLFSSLDASIVSTSLVSISLDLQDFINAPWIALSYLLAYLGFAVGFAKMSDIYGRRALIIVAWLLFAGFSIGCGSAQNTRSLIVFRAFQGIGGSGLYSLAQVGLVEVGPSHKPGLLGALIGSTLAVSFVLGPVLGGIISHLATWRWIFFINIPCGAIALLGLIFAWPPTQGARLSSWDAFRSIDFLGNTLLIAASCLLVFALQEAGSFTFAWDSPVIIITLVLAALSWTSFLTWELYLGLRCFTHVEPVFPLRLAMQRTYIAALACTFFTGFAYIATIIILPERFQIVNGDDSLMAGIHLLPMLGGCAFGSFLAGAISQKKNNTSVTLMVGSCLQLVGIALLSTLSDVLTAVQAQYGYQTIFGLGVGLSFGAATILTVVLGGQDLAVAQGAIAQARVFGGAVGIAVCMIIFNIRAQSQLVDVMTPEDLKVLHQSPTISSYFPPDIQTLIRKAYATAFSDDIKIMIGMSGAAVLASIFTFQRHPQPLPLPTQREHKEALGVQGAQSETELEDMASNH